MKFTKSERELILLMYSQWVYEISDMEDTKESFTLEEIVSQVLNIVEKVK